MGGSDRSTTKSDVSNLATTSESFGTESLSLSRSTTRKEPLAKKIEEYLVQTPPKMAVNGIVYAEEGAGKSTFANSDPEHWLIDCGNSARFLRNARRIDASEWSLANHVEFLESFAKEPTGNLHYDEFTQLVKMVEYNYRKKMDGPSAMKEGRTELKNINNIGKFGEGIKQVNTYIRNELFTRWANLQKQYSTNIILYCHAEERPTGEDTKQKEFRLRMGPKYAQNIMEWADFIGFLHIQSETYINNKGNERDRKTGKRILQLHQDEGATAKNRFGVNEFLLDPDWTNLMNLFNKKFYDNKKR